MTFIMSLDVPPALQERAEAGQVADTDFVACVRQSLPYAWTALSQAAGQLDADEGIEFGEHAAAPPTEADRGQLLRALASDSIRTGLERHFGVRFAFQNCHRVAAFRLSAVGGASYLEFVSPLAQIRNQTPELRDC
jgi:hypothetical protein